MEEMKNLLEERFHFISEVNKEFLLSFDEEMEKLGYGIYEVKDAYPWAMNWIGAKYMINYKVKRLKTRKLVAHVFIKEDGIFLRLFALKNNVRTINTREKARSVIAPHRAYIESAPPHIKKLFTVEVPACHHCNDDNGNGYCYRLDTYTVDGNVYERCIGKGFDIWDPTMEKLPDYIEMLSELNSKKKSDPVQ